MTPMQAVGLAAKEAGGQSALAAILGVKPPTVHQWLSGERPVPPARAIAIEKAVAGAVSRQNLCPEFPWDQPITKSRSA